MAFLAANAALRVAGRPQFLVFVIPWVRKKNGILCLKNREYSSSVPVRYVPKKYSRVKDSEDGILRNSVEKNELKNVHVELRDEVARNGRSGVKGSVVLDEKFRYQNRNEGSSKDNVRFNDVAKQVEKLQNQYRSEVFSKKSLAFGDDSAQGEKLQYQNRKEVSFKDDSKQGVAELGLMEEHDEVSEDGILRNNVEKNELKNVHVELRNEAIRNGGSDVKGSVVLDEKFRYQNRNEVSSKDNVRFNDVAKQVEKLQNQYRSETFSKKSLSFGDDSVQGEKLQYQNRDEVSFNDDSKQVERLQMGNWNEMQSKNHLLFEEDVKQGVAELGLMEEHDEVSEEPEESLEQMKIPTQSDRQKLSLAGKSAQDAENMAIKLLAKRAFTVVELRKKLNGKNFPPETVEAVLKDFKSRGLINDSMYAETYSRSRWSSSSWGPRRIKQALFIKGVSNSDADNAVKLVFNNTESDDSLESNFGMSKASMDHLFVQASKQWLRSQNSPPDTRKVRIIRWLQYRGFNWGVTNFIVKKLEFHYPT